MRSWILAATLGLWMLPHAASAQDSPRPLEAEMRSGLAELSHAGVEHWDLARWRESLLALYESRRFTPLWFKGRAPTAQTLALLTELRASASRGLRPDDYGGNRLAARLAGLAGSASAGEADFARLDLELSVAAARLISDLHAGRIDPRAAGNDLDVPHSRLDVRIAVLALASTTDVRAVLDDYEPPFRRYDLLKVALARYRELAMTPELNALPPLPGRSVKPGESYEGMPQLRMLLRALGDLGEGDAPAPEDAGRLDARTVQGLAAFQARHGLGADGVLGPGTWRALGVPLAERVRQIERSLERLRWLPPQLGSPPIIVNIPQFELFAFATTEDREDSLLIMDVIVGKSFPRNNTPVFAADLRYIVLRPYWDVPASILREEFLPRIRANPGWIARNGFEIVRGQGDASPTVEATEQNVELLARGQLRLRQKPGPGNALGLAKFMFPNRYNVYLHGTPAQALFAQARRDFSHGCVRVADPVALASFVLRDDPTWSRERIEAAMQGQAPTRINLKNPIRVYLLYGTALATEKGQTLFFEDIYGLDARLDRLLAARRGAAVASKGNAGG